MIWPTFATFCVQVLAGAVVARIALDVLVPGIDALSCALRGKFNPLNTSPWWGVRVILRLTGKHKRRKNP